MTAAAAVRTWSLRLVGERPVTMNRHRTLHPFERARVDKVNRETFAWLAKKERIPALHRIEVVALPLHANNASPQDVAACAPAVKAAIDGLVDAGVIPDDTAAHLQAVTFLPALVDGDDGLLLMIREVA